MKLRPERHNGVKLLVFFDVGGSMDAHVAEVQRLFSALRHEFKHLVFFYFHNCLYDFVWQDNARRFEERFDTPAAAAHLRQRLQGDFCGGCEDGTL